MTDELAIRLQNLVITPGPAQLGPTPRAGVLSEAELTQELKFILSDARILPDARDLVRALLLLWHDQLDAAHTISQSIENRDGNLVHAILHRREPDYWNSKYWWRRVGAHPSFVELGKHVAQFLTSQPEKALMAKLVPRGNWDALEFVNLCEAVAGEAQDSRRTKLLREIQQLETQAALRYFVRDHFCLEFALP